MRSAHRGDVRGSMHAPTVSQNVHRRFGSSHSVLSVMKWQPANVAVSVEERDKDSSAVIDSEMEKDDDNDLDDDVEDDEEIEDVCSEVADVVMDDEEVIESDVVDDSVSVDVLVSEMVMDLVLVWQYSLLLAPST